LVKEDVVRLRETVARFAEAAGRDVARVDHERSTGAWGRSASVL